MSEDLLKSLLPALHIAAFERREDGSFTSLAPPPAWFGRLVADPAFPFLGHILEEANVFWRSGGPGLREWGPVAEVDATVERRLGRVVLRERLAQALVLEQPLQDALDRLHRPQRAFEPRPTPAGHDHRELARPHLPEPLAVDHDRHAGREVRLAEEELPAAAKLDDDGVAQTLRPGGSAAASARSRSRR